MTSRKIRTFLAIILTLTLAVLAGCSSSDDHITQLSQLDGREFAVPAGTVADQLVLKRFPSARFMYYDTVLAACMAVLNRQADVAAYDEPILKNIAAKYNGLTVLPERITTDYYGVAVKPESTDLKNTIDAVISELRENGTYEAMLTRWLPETGAPAPMPEIPLNGSNGVLRLGTAAVTEPFSFFSADQKVVGFDIELASYVARKLGMRLEIVNMDFGAMIPALTAGEVDMIAACITITDERAKSILFSDPYYVGGIAALVRK